MQSDKRDGGHNVKSHAEHQHILDLVASTVREVEPEAEVFFFGSRARGDAEEMSDWDFLIVLSGDVDLDREQSIRHRLYEIEWEFGPVISTIILTREQWNSGLYQELPFSKNVRREGIIL
jgi:predicted nucleotidyltransferase